MKKKLEQHNIYLRDSFFKNHELIYDFVLDKYNAFTPTYRDSGDFFMTIDSELPDQWFSLLDKKKNFIQSKYKKQCSLKSTSLTAVVYEQESHKAPHTDHSHSFFDENGVYVIDEFSYTSIFFLNQGFIGGKLCFDLLDIEIEPVAGTFIVFPSNYIHSVSKIQSGTRFVITKFWRTENEY